MFNAVFRHASLYIIGLIVCFLFLMVSSAPVSAIHWQDSVEEARKKQAETAKPVMLYEFQYLRQLSELALNGYVMNTTYWSVRFKDLVNENNFRVLRKLFLFV